MSHSPNLRVLSALAAAILLALPACGGGDDRNEAETFTDPAGYSLEVPAEWTLSDRTEADGLIRADIGPGGNVGIQVRVVPLSAGGFAATTSAMLREYEADMSGHWGGSLEELERTSPGAGEEALTVRFRADRSDGSAWYLQESFVGGGDILVVLQGGCPWEQRSGIREAFDAIVESVRFG